MMIDKLKIEDDKLNQELEDSHGDPNRMKVLLKRGSIFTNDFSSKTTLVIWTELV